MAYPLDALLTLDNRRHLTNAMGDMVLLLWDFYYKKFGGQSLQEDISRVRILIRGKAGQPMLAPGLDGDINKACGIYELIIPSRTENIYDPRQDLISEEIPKRSQANPGRSGRLYHFERMVKDLDEHYTDLPVPGISLPQIQLIQEVFRDFRGSVMAIRGPRNRHIHGAQGLSDAGAIQAISAGIRICELYTNIVVTLKNTGWVSSLESGDYTFDVASGLGQQLSEELWSHLADKFNSRTPIDSRSLAPSNLPNESGSSEAREDARQPMVKICPEQFDPILEQLNELVTSREHSSVQLLREIQSAILILRADFKDLKSRVSHDTSPGIPAGEVSPVHSIEGVRIGISQANGRATAADVNRAIRVAIPKDQAAKELLSMRDQVANQLKASFPHFKAYHNILQSGAVHSALNQNITDMEGYQGLFPIQRILELNEDGEDMVDMQVDLFGAQIVSILRAAIQSDGFDSEDE